MFDRKTYEDRLAYWAMFRDSLDKSQTPLQDVNKKYNTLSLESQRYDPWDKSNWPTPWTLIFENRYCAFLKALGICYSLKLTETYKHKPATILIAKDEDLQTRYLCVIDNHVLGLNNEVFLRNDIDNRFSILKEITLDDLQ